MPGFSILKLIRYLKAELLLVLGTSSSEAALPSLIEKMEHAGCRKSVVGLVIPTGYSFNLDGTNIYMSLAALFIAQATGVHLTLGEELLLLGVAMLSSKGAAGVTGSGFITLAATLAIVPAVPVAGNGADPGRGPFHERMPKPDQFHRQRRGDDRRLRMGGWPRPQSPRRRAIRQNAWRRRCHRGLEEPGQRVKTGGDQTGGRQRDHPRDHDGGRDIPANGRHPPRAAPTPTIAPVMVWVVETGMPSQVAPNRVIAPPVSAQKPCCGVKRVILDPMVWTIRQPPSNVPVPIAAWQDRTTHKGTWNEPPSSPCE